MISIERLHGPLWCIQTTAYSQVLREEADKTPGVRFDKAMRAYIGYPDAIHVTAKRAAARGLRIQGWLDLGGPTGLLVAKKGLRNYQVEGVEFLIAKSSEGCLLADEMGVGKSAQAATACRALRQRAVIVCPNSVRGVWLDPDPREGQLAQWWPAARVFGASGTKPDSPIDPAINVVVIHYEILFAWVDRLIEWGAKTLVFDEGHRLVNLEAKRSQAAKKLAEACTHRMVLTGTPIENRIKQFYGPIEVISPGRFSSPGSHPFFRFGLRYCGGHQDQIDIHIEGVPVQKRVWKFDGTSHLDELRDRVSYSPATPWGFILRRLKSEVELELPPRTRQIIPIEVKRSFIAKFDFGDRMMSGALALAAEGKWPAVVDLVVDHLESGGKVVVGVHQRRIAERIAGEVAQKIKATIRVSHGGLAVEKRNDLYRSKPDLLCVTFDSCKEGVNLLSYATNVVIAELTYNATTLLQFENRFGRFAGQKVLIQYCIARGTADDVIRKAVLSKLDASKAALGKGDDRLDIDLKGLVKAGPEGQAERLKRLYESVIAREAS